MKKCVVSVCFLYLLMAIIFTFPLLLNFTTRIVGAQHDAYENIWLSWWLSYSQDKGLVIWHSNYVGHPYGIDIWRYVHLLIPYCLALISKILPLIPAFNLFTLLAIFLSALFTYMLVRYLTSNPFASFISGLIYAFSPYVYWEIWQGSLELVHVEWIPLYCLFLFKLGEKHSPIRNIFFALMTLLIACLCNWYYGVFLIFFTFLYLVYLFIISERSFFLKSAAPKIFLVVTFTFFLSLPFILKINRHLPSYKDINWDDNNTKDICRMMASQSLEIKYKLLGLSIFSDHKNYIRTLPLHIADDSIPLRNIFPSFKSKPHLRAHKNFFTPLTFILFLISLIVVLIFKRKKRNYFYLTVFIIFLILSLGPYRMIRNEVVLHFPSYWLYKFIPGFSLVGSRPYRFSIFSILMVSLMIGESLDFFSQKIPRFSFKKYFPLLGILFVFEYVINPTVCFPLPSLNARVPAAYKKLLHLKEGNLIELPLYEYPFLNSEYIYYQIFHHRPILNTSELSYKINPKYLQLIQRNIVLKNLISIYTNGSYQYFDKKRYRKALTALKQYNFRYIIFHVSNVFYNPFRETYCLSSRSPLRSLMVCIKMFEFLNSLLGEPLEFTDGIAIYEIK